MNREGFYSIIFQGRTGWGAGVIVLDTGVVVGADPFGGTYDGTYIYNPATDRLDIDVVVTMAPGTEAVTGVAAGASPVKFPAKLSIPRGNVTGLKHTATTPSGPIDLVLNKIRDFP